MKDIPVFTTENGVASLTLREIPYSRKAYFRIQSASDAAMLIKECVEYLEKGAIHYCKKGSSHSVINEFDEDLVMLCIVPNQ